MSISHVLITEAEPTQTTHPSGRTQRSGRRPVTTAHRAQMTLR